MNIEEGNDANEEMEITQFVSELDKVKELSTSATPKATLSIDT